MAPGPLDFIPGLREAEDRYRQENAEAFAGVEPSICQMMNVLPFTPQMFIELDGAGNAFFAQRGTPITAADVAVFLWRVSPVYVKGNDDLRRLYIAHCAVIPYDKAVSDIQEYIRRSWAGMPLWPGKSGSMRRLGQWPAALVHIFAKEYGWSEETILNMPFRRLWQYANRVLEEHDTKYHEKCGEAMKLRTQWLIEQNTPAGRN